MARLNIVDPTTATGKAKEMYDGPIKGKHINVFQGMMNNPTVFEALLGFMGGVKGGSLTNAEHELVALATAGTNNCAYCKAAHTAIAAGVGLSSDQIASAIKIESADDKSAALLNFTNAMVTTNGNVTDEQLNNFKAAGYDDAAVVEVVGAIAVNTFTNVFNHVNQTEIDPAFQPAGASA